MTTTYDINDPQVKITQLYLALLNRAPDLAGLNTWMQELDSSKSVSAVADGIFAAEEARLIFPDPSNHAGFTDTIYQNLLGRAPDAEGLAYWTGQLDLGRTPGDVLVDLIAAVENYGGTDATALASQTALAQRVADGIRTLATYAGDAQEAGDAQDLGAAPDRTAGADATVSASAHAETNVSAERPAQAEASAGASASTQTEADVGSDTGAHEETVVNATPDADVTGNAANGKFSAATNTAIASDQEQESGSEPRVSASASASADAGETSAGSESTAGTGASAGDDSEIVGTNTFLAGEIITKPVLTESLMNSIADALNAQTRELGSLEEVFAFSVNRHHDGLDEVYLFHYVDTNHDALVQGTELVLAGVASNNGHAAAVDFVV